MRLIFFLVVSIVPGLLWVWFFYRRDFKEPEPKALVLKLYGYGALSVVPAALIESPFRSLISDSANLPLLFIMSIFVVGLAEEGSKLLAVRYGAYDNEEFSEVMDGIIYSVTAGLGFATAENVLYTLNFGLSVGLTRIIIAYLAHATFSGIAGFYLGMAKFHPEQRVRSVIIGLSLAVLLHGLYDFFIIGRIVSPIFVIIGLVMVYTMLSRTIEHASKISPYKGKEPGDA